LVGTKDKMVVETRGSSDGKPEVVNFKSGDHAGLVGTKDKMVVETRGSSDGKPEVVNFKSVDQAGLVGTKDKMIVEKKDIKPMTIEETPKSPVLNLEKNVSSISEKQNETGKESNPRTFTFPTPASSKQVFNTTSKKEEGSTKPLPVIYVSGKPFVPKPKLDGSSTMSSSFVEPQQQPLKKESLVNVTNNLAESMTTLVLESSDSTLQSSTIHSAATSLQMEKLSQQTGEDNFKVSNEICASMNQISGRSEAGELDDCIKRKLSEACNETGKNSSKLSDEIAAITNSHSIQTAADVDPISLYTRNLQAVATEGLEDHLSQGVDALVRDIMKATSVV